MFIGEMGCWLIVASYAIYNRFSERREYTAIAEDEGDDTNPALKPLLAKEDRVVMKGRAILLLALPSTCDLAATTLMNGVSELQLSSPFVSLTGALSWLAICRGFDISNDPWCSCPLRWSL